MFINIGEIFFKFYIELYTYIIYRYKCILIKYKIHIKVYYFINHKKTDSQTNDLYTIHKWYNIHYMYDVYIHITKYCIENNMHF